MSGRTVESGGRWSRRPGRPRRRAARRLRLPDRVVSSLAGAIERTDFVHGQFGENFTVEGCRTTPSASATAISRQRAVRGHSTPRHLLSRRHSDERAADAGAADIQRTNWLLLPRPAGRRLSASATKFGRWAGGRAHDRGGDQRTSLFARSFARSTGARVADRGAFTWMALVVRGVAQESNRCCRQRKRGADAGGSCASGSIRISASHGDRDGSGVRGRPLPDDAERRWSAAPSSHGGPVRGLRLRTTVGGPPVFRSYSLSGPLSTERYRISVKVEPNGMAGTYLREHVAIGDALDVSSPRGSFVLQSGERPVVLLSAGIGATPVLAMLYALAAAHLIAPGPVAARGSRSTASSVRGGRSPPRKRTRARAQLCLLQQAGRGRQGGRGFRRCRASLEVGL